VPQDAEGPAPIVSPPRFGRALPHEHRHRAGQIAGRVEHVVSGQATHFASPGGRLLALSPRLTQQEERR